MVLLVEEYVGHVFHEGDNYTEKVKVKFSKKFPKTPVPPRNSKKHVLLKIPNAVEDYLN